MPRRPIAAFALALLVAVGALTAQRQPLGAQALSLGDENSWVRIQNVGAKPATVDLTFFDSTGAKVASDGCPKAGQCSTIAPGVGWSFFQQGFAGLNVGYRGSALVKADQPFVGLLARDAFKGGLFQIDGDTMRLGRGTSGMAFPFVHNTDDYVSRITLENTSDTRDACVEIRFWGQGQGAATTIDPPGPTTGCPSGGTRLEPHQTLERNETSLRVPFGFDGSAVVRTYDTAAGTRAGDQTLVGTVNTRERRGPGLGEKRGIAVDEQRPLVALPLIERNASSGGIEWNTRFRIMNANPGVPNDVKIRFEGTNASGDKVEINHTLTVLSALTCDQRSTGAAGCLPSDRDLSSSFVGSVRLEATNPIAVVVQRTSSAGGFSDYRGFTVGEASRQVVLPVLDKNFGPFGDTRGWNSWFRVASFDGSPAYVRVIYYARQSPTGQLRDPINAAGAITVFQAADGNLQDGWVGSAIVISDQPIIVLVGIESDVFQGDAAMLYNGVGFD